MSGLVAGPGEPGNVEPAERNGEGIGKCGLCSRVAAVGDNGEITVGLGELDILVLGNVKVYTSESDMDQLADRPLPLISLSFIHGPYKKSVSCLFGLIAPAKVWLCK